MRLGRRPMLVLVPLAWLAVVVAVAGLTWQVIDSAGRQVLTSGGPAPLTASGSAPRADGRTPAAPSARPRDDRPNKSGTAPSGKPSGAPAQAGPTTGATASPAPTPSAPAPAGEPTGQSAPPPAPAQPNPPPTPAPQPTRTTQAPQPTSEVRSWQGAAGTVTAACTGTRISLRSVTPSDGWQLEVGDRGPERIEVQLNSGGDENERETHVRAACSGGVPRFQVEADD